MPNNKIIDLERLSRFKDKLDIELDKKANVDGNYPTMTVGSADNLTPYGENSGVEESAPFVFQSSGGSSDIGSQAYLKSLRGNSVAFNQIVSGMIPTRTNISGLTFTNNGDGSLTITGTASADFTAYDLILSTALTTNHTYLGKLIASDNNSHNYFRTNRPSMLNGIGTFTGTSGNMYVTFNCSSGDEINVKVSYQLFDLTLMFGAGNEPTSVEEFNRLFPKPYYEYNAGTLLSCKSNGYKTVGYNAFDGELEIGGYYTSTGGDNNNATDRIRTKNPIKVIAGQTYTLEIENLTFTSFFVLEYDENLNYLGEYKIANPIVLEQNCHYVKFMITGPTAITTDPQIAFHLTWDESRTGYEPYNSETYSLPNVEIRSAGSVYDELKPDGTLIRRVGVVDLGTLTWNNNESFASGLFSATVSGMNNTTESSQRNKGITCSKYIPSSVTALNNNIPNKSMLRYNAGIFIRDSAFEGKTTDEVKSLVNNIYLNYELATPTEEQTEYTFAETTPIDDYGTQEFLYDSNIDIPVPQGNEFFYPVDYKAFIDSLGGRDDIEYAADQVVSQTQLTQALSTLLSSIQGYDATKTQTLKNVSGVFQWVDD